ncbi:hypothetical protein TREPR_0488 [Treponema primitia ZAS-2]|uniref:HEAT repeat domain-containing protein n=1 Tax=Treponema primitia (strain ATCC BAA-887 / DSM 12427 / ZAS-2) TaxID=545694 RepID=F5YLF0_TREPZ|nr:hypothetical protein [Treponema primitia]AEF85118.1 hypothetical protein TREPR_0488 [Treponema primitia ZAS-2]
MKRIFLILGFISCVAGMGFAASAEDLEIYMYLYNNSRSVTDQYAILTVLQTLKLNGAGEFYATALNRLVNQYPNIQRSAPVLEKTAADDLAQTLSALLGEEKYTTAAPDLWRTIGAFTAPNVKAEALIALGKMRATDFLPQVVRILQDLNSAPPAGREEADSKGKIARGAIIALEKFRDPSGYLPVFFMATGGYPDSVKQLAKATLPVILEDPSAPLTEVIRSASYPYSIKFLALQTEEEANIGSQPKAGVAVAALSEGWRAATNDVRQRQDLLRIRKTSIDMIKRYSTTDPAVYPLLERSFKEGGDDNEKLDSITALAALGSEDAVKLLSSFLQITTGRYASQTNNRSDEALIRSLINNLGVSAANVSGPVRESAKSSLRSVGAVPNLTPAVKNLASDALTKLN